MDSELMTGASDIAAADGHGGPSVAYSNQQVLAVADDEILARQDTPGNDLTAKAITRTFATACRNCLAIALLLVGVLASAALPAYGLFRLVRMLLEG